VGQLEQNLSAGDNHSARRNAHTLKGACGLLGAKRLQAIATDIETAGREERISDHETSMALLEALQSEASRVLDAIDELLAKKKAQS
jgi:HPt (histidine-containing phosphotransfer) domain-containing protein